MIVLLFLVKLLKKKKKHLIELLKKITSKFINISKSLFLILMSQAKVSFDQHSREGIETFKSVIKGGTQFIFVRIAFLKRLNIFSQYIPVFRH